MDKFPHRKRNVVKNKALNAVGILLECVRFGVISSVLTCTWSLFRRELASVLLSS